MAVRIWESSDDNFRGPRRHARHPAIIVSGGPDGLRVRAADGVHVGRIAGAAVRFT